jgi:hypothetical protein
MARGTAGFIGNEPAFQGGPEAAAGGFQNLSGIWTAQEAYARQFAKRWASSLPLIGDPFEGGFFAGLISHTADGVPTHALIVAPRATGASGTGYPISTNLQWKTTNTATANTSSPFDGAANTAAMVTAGIALHPAANFCVNLTIGGFSDWYFPARFEQEIAYYHLKRDTTSNNTGFGINNYSVPKRTLNYTAGDPTQTSVLEFRSGASEPYSPDGHWSSTENNFETAHGLTFSNGAQFINPGGTGKNTARLVRAFRRIELYP